MVDCLVIYISMQHCRHVLYGYHYMYINISIYAKNNNNIIIY